MSWHDTAATRTLGLRFPIVQGPFGGGLSSPRLAATVSNAGGLGSYGAQGMTPDGIRAIVADIRALTTAPFAMNLWVSTADARPADIPRGDYDGAIAVLSPIYAELGVAPPPFPLNDDPAFAEQLEALLEARPPVFSFVFGVPSPEILDRCRTLGIKTIGAATTVEEARALDGAGVDAIVATGSEAGGHRPSFLRTAEASLTTTLSLVPQVADAVRAPIVAAGGIADGRGVAAVLALGAQAAQIGTAFLACDESNAHPVHRAALRARPTRTTLTRGLTGRLGRAVHNRIVDVLAEPAVAKLPYPFQGHLVAPIKRAALDQARSEWAPFWSGQSVAILRHQRAADLFAELVQVDGRAARRFQI
jgi:nitronate monooxygenase